VALEGWWNDVVGAIVEHEWMQTSDKKTYSQSRTTVTSASIKQALFDTPPNFHWGNYNSV